MPSRRSQQEPAGGYVRSHPRTGLDPRDFGQQPPRVGKILQGVVGDRDIGRSVREGQRLGQVGEAPPPRRGYDGAPL